jgi:hypothetical protein
VTFIEKATTGTLNDVGWCRGVQPNVGAHGDYRDALDIRIDTLINMHMAKHCQVNLVLKKNRFE